MTLKTTIYCHSPSDKIRVSQYMKSQRYSQIVDLTGVELELTDARLGTKMFDYVVAPGNSIGEMTGGFDLGLVDAFGELIQHNVTEIITYKHQGELNVGAAEVVATGSDAIPHCVYAPTMRTPRTLEPDTDVPYVATRAAVIAMMNHGLQGAWGVELTASVLIPLMGVGTGGVYAKQSACQIHLAVGSFSFASRIRAENLRQASGLDRMIRDKTWLQ